MKRKKDLRKRSEYKTWQAMHARCYRPSANGFERYGARGIKVCERWHTFEAFLSDMGPKPPGFWIERKDNDGDYTPDNCCWTTPKEQANNKSTSRFVELRGERLTIAQWADRVGMDRQVLWQRLKGGWAAEDAVFEPVRPRGTGGRNRRLGKLIPIRAVRKPTQKRDTTTCYERQERKRMRESTAIVIYHVSDVADELTKAGLKCRTPAAVRSAVEEGRLNPDLESPRGVKAWTHEALMRDVESMWRAQRIRSTFGRQALRQPEQLQIGGPH